MGRPYWIRHLANELLAADSVVRTRLYSDRLNVWYATGFRRSYVYHDLAKRRWARPIAKEESKFEWPIAIDCEFEQSPFGRDPILEPYFHISRNTIKTLSYIQKEVLIQSLILRIQKHGYRKPYITEDTIEDELTWLLGIQHVFYRGVFDAFASCGRRGRRPGQRLIEHYYPVEQMHRGDDRRTLANAFATTKILFVALQRLIHRTKWDLNLSTLHNILYLIKYGPKWINPAFWKVVLHQLFKPKGRTLTDASPNINEKAITAALLGCKYTTIDGSKPPVALCERLGLKVVDPTETHDLTIFDNRLKPPSIPEVLALAAKSKDLLVYVPRSLAKALSQTLCPTRIVKIKTTPLRIRQDPDYLFVYSAKI